MIAVWIPVTVVPTSLATVAIDTFITELSSVIRNWPEASVSSTSPEALATCFDSTTRANVTADGPEQITQRGL